MRILSFCRACLCVGSAGPAGCDRCHHNWRQPWHEVAQRLGRPPVLSYASYALDNWRRLDQTKPIQLDNIVLLQNFLGGLDEEWFVVVHIQIEREAGPGLAGLLRAMNGAAEGQGGRGLARSSNPWRWLKRQCETRCIRMKERCDPYVYYNRVRPYIHGWKNSPSLPNGIAYEGVESYAGQPQQLRGETGAQSSIVPSLDAGLGIAHAPDPLTLYLQEMRDYMPPRHRSFIEVLEKATDDLGRPLLSGYVRDPEAPQPLISGLPMRPASTSSHSFARSTSATPTATFTANIKPTQATPRPWEQVAHPS